jgi:hypothetical protein
VRNYNRKQRMGKEEAREVGVFFPSYFQTSRCAIYSLDPSSYPLGDNKELSHLVETIVAME